MTTKTQTKAQIDWWAVTQAAAGLGINTRRLVALREPDQAIEWALRMSREHGGVASLSYYELAVMLGYQDPKVTAGASLAWNELLLAVEKLQAAVKEKIADENAAAEKAAEKKAAEEKAAREKAAKTKTVREAAGAARKQKAEKAVPDAA
jgi:hypothetical protein